VRVVAIDRQAVLAQTMLSIRSATAMRAMHRVIPFFSVFYREELILNTHEEMRLAPFHGACRIGLLGPPTKFTTLSTPTSRELT
jgi:hypothetical protein